MGNRPINRRPWRRPPWRKRLKPGEKGWINGVSTNCGWAPLTAGGTCEPGGGNYEPTWNRIEIISGAELAEHEGSVKLIRLVGDMLLEARFAPDFEGTMNPANVAGTMLRMGLIVVDADMTSGSEIIPFVDPTDVESMDRSWLWLRTEWIRPYYKNTAGIGPATWVPNETLSRIDLDLRVQRRLKADQRLVMMVSAVNTLVPDDSEQTVDLAANLRAFIAF